MTTRKPSTLTRKSRLETILEVLSAICRNYLDVQSGRYGYNLGKKLRSR